MIFVAATFALPQRKYRIRISLALVHSAARRNDLPLTHRTDAAARGAALDIDLKHFGYVSHNSCRQAARAPISPFSILEGNVKDR